MKEDVPAILIKKRYLKPPTLEQIQEFVEEMDITYAQFERYYSMSDGIMKQVNNGYKPMPVKYWPIIYEKIIPTYGTSYKDINRKIFGLDKKVTKKVSLSIPKANHGRLTDVK